MLEAIRWRRRGVGRRGRRPIRHLFLFIGAEPNTDWLCGSGVALDAKGFVLTGAERASDRRSLETSRRGVFAIGDVRCGFGQARCGGGRRRRAGGGDAACLFGHDATRAGQSHKSRCWCKAVAIRVLPPPGFTRILIHKESADEASRCILRLCLAPCPRWRYGGTVLSVARVQP